MNQHIGRAAFGNLGKAGGLAARSGVDVQRIERGPLALRWKLGGELSELVQIAHLLLAQQIIDVRPAFQTLCGTYANKPAACLQHFQPFAMLESGNHGGSGSQILTKIDGGRSRESDSDCGRLGLRWRLGLAIG